VHIVCHCTGIERTTGRKMLVTSNHSKRGIRLEHRGMTQVIAVTVPFSRRRR
jgi:hypothetical protein